MVTDKTPGLEGHTSVSMKIRTRTRNETLTKDFGTHAVAGAGCVETFLALPVIVRLIWNTFKISSPDQAPHDEVDCGEPFPWPWQSS